MLKSEEIESKDCLGLQTKEAKHQGEGTFKLVKCRAYSIFIVIIKTMQCNIILSYDCSKSGVLKKVGQQNALKGALNKRNSASPDQKFVTLQNLKG